MLQVSEWEGGQSGIESSLQSTVPDAPENVGCGMIDECGISPRVHRGIPEGGGPFFHQVTAFTALHAPCWLAGSLYGNPVRGSSEDIRQLFRHQ